MSVNIDKKAEETARTLMGQKKCPACGGDGTINAGFGNKEKCKFCGGEGWWLSLEINFAAIELRILSQGIKKEDYEKP